MARKDPTKRTNSNRFLNYSLEAASGNDSHYLDIGRDLSKTNRALYRQGKIYRIKNITVLNRQADCQMRIGVCPPTWVSKAAWRRGKSTWNKMNREAAATLEGKQVYPKWHDFKVFLNPSMMDDPDQPEPVDINGNTADAGEWAYSQFETPDGHAAADQFYVHLLGNHNGSAGSRVSVGLIQSYGESRGHYDGTDATPSHDTQFEHDPLANLFDYGTVLDEVLENLDSDNDTPPYSVGSGGTIGDAYPGAANNMQSAALVAMVSITDIAEGNGFASTGPIDAMCGLIEIETYAASAQDIEILVELEEGDYRGVAAFDI